MITEIYRSVLIGYVLVSPFIFVYLQQNLFRDSFDDEHGSEVIKRLHLITTIGCLGFYVMTLHLENFCK